MYTMDSTPRHEVYFHASRANLESKIANSAKDNPESVTSSLEQSGEQVLAVTKMRSQSEQQTGSQFAKSNTISASDFS